MEIFKWLATLAVVLSLIVMTGCSATPKSNSLTSTAHANVEADDPYDNWD